MQIQKGTDKCLSKFNAIEVPPWTVRVLGARCDDGVVSRRSTLGDAGYEPCPAGSD